MKINKVHSDDRRAIYVLDGLLRGDKEFSIIKLKKGKAIGGCMHTVPENVVVISGMIWVTYNDEEPFTMTTGESDYIEAGKAHMFHAVESSIVIEWGVPASQKQDGAKLESMLKEVKRINEKGTHNGKE